MSLQTYIESLREKPDHIRTRYAFLTSLGITAIIAAFWVGSFTQLGQSTQSQVATAISTSVGTPGQTLVASVGSFFNDIKEIIFGSKKVTYSSVEVSAGRR